MSSWHILKLYQRTNVFNMILLFSFFLTHKIRSIHLWSIILSGKRQAMAMALPKTHWVWAYSMEWFKYYDSSVLVDHLADPDHWYKSVLTQALHDVVSYLTLMCLNWSSIFSCMFTYSGTCINCPNHFIIFGGLITSSLTNY